MKILLDYQTVHEQLLCEDTAQAELSSMSIDLVMPLFPLHLNTWLLKGYKKIGYSLGEKKQKQFPSYKGRLTILSISIIF